MPAHRYQSLSKSRPTLILASTGPPSLPPSLPHLESCFTNAKANRNKPLEKKEETTVNFCSPADMKELKKAATTLGVALGPGGMEGGAILTGGWGGRGGREGGREE